MGQNVGLRRSFVVIALVGGLGAWAAFGQVAVPAYPATFSQELTASGRLVGVRALGLRQRFCRLDIVVHEWINLSRGFALTDIPQKGERVSLYAPRELCAAAQIAAAGAEGHLRYRAGEGRVGAWFLTERPSPALSCGGRWV